MPDIDVDFCYERRDEVIRYVREKYGEDRVAGIITFGTLKGKAAIKDVGRVFEFSYGETDKMAKLYPAPVQGKDHPLEKALEIEPKLREMRDRGTDRERELFDYAFRLEGLMRHASRHAAGIVIANRPLSEYLPLFVDKEGAVLTQYPMNDVEWIGLIKFDFLGLKTLTFLADAVAMIRATRPESELDLSKLPLDDAKTYKLLAKGDTVGIFQMESGGMRKMITQLRPSRFAIRCDEQREIHAVAQHRDALGCDAQIEPRLAQRCGNGDQCIRVPGHPAYPAPRHSVTREGIDIRASRRDHDRLAEPPTQQQRRRAVRKNEMRVDEVEILLPLQLAHCRQRAQRHRQRIDPARHSRDREEARTLYGDAVTRLVTRDARQLRVSRRPEAREGHPRNRRDDAGADAAACRQLAYAVLDEDPVTRLRGARIQIGERQHPHARTTIVTLRRSGA